MDPDIFSGRSWEIGLKREFASSFTRGEFETLKIHQTQKLASPLAISGMPLRIEVSRLVKALRVDDLRHPVAFDERCHHPWPPQDC